MATIHQVMLGKLTQSEFKEALLAGKYHTAIIPTGSIEQHSAHLAMEQDIATAIHISQKAAQQLFPHVIVAPPINIGIAEEHMLYKGTITASPSSWLGILFDTVESFVRHGLRRILILNGHGGNVTPLDWVLWFCKQRFLTTGIDADVRCHSYWELCRKDAEKYCKGDIPGHAQEYETALALALFPKNVRLDVIQKQQDKELLGATAEQGHILADTAIRGVVEVLQDMMK